MLSVYVSLLKPNQIRRTQMFAQKSQGINSLAEFPSVEVLLHQGLDLYLWTPEPSDASLNGLV